MRIKKPEVIPCDVDKYWIKATEPLVELLKKNPITIKDLQFWTKEIKSSFSYSIQMLAWCENRHLVYYSSGKWIYCGPRP